MRKEYDFSKGIRNPYARRLKKPVTIRLEIDTINHFKKMSVEVDVPYQKLMNSFLRDCAIAGTRPKITWAAPRKAHG
jgi:hypothetical protein